MMPVTTSHATMIFWLQSFCTRNTSGSVMPMSTPPIRMKGRRRPQRVRALSDSQPNTGSLKPSHIR